MTAHPLQGGTHVLVADGEKALLLVNAGDAEHPHLKVAREARQDPPPEPADKPGRFNDGPSVHRSAVEESDWQRLAKEGFAEDLARMLYRRAHAGRIDRLILVASPMVLGALRSRLHKEVADLVVAEIDKTLTNHPIPEIEKLVAEALGG
ncbi:MAG: host attachment family protein [Rhodobacteraceae bacterium]|jgi:protein required for attachment to host cells|nr:host attachment family protein [Paracoccaceae bacterium]